MTHFLIIDDEPMVCRMLGAMISQSGHTWSAAGNLSAGMKAAFEEPVDVVLLDVHLPDGSGLDILNQLQQTAGHPEVVIMTGQSDADGAELAIRNGAWDYLEKPVDKKKMMLVLKRVIQYRESMPANPVTSASLDRENIIGDSFAIQKCLDQLAQAAAVDSNTLIIGETGTGKELFARGIHMNSNRSDGKFVVVDCAALPDNLVESILFGHEKGAFTGAEKEQEGLVAQADGGTLFLDEIGELPLSIQKVFLRTLQEKCFRKVGGQEEIYCDFRLVAATNRDLNDMAESGKFRKDLLFRLRSLSIPLPPLRHRKEDLKALALYHLARICSRLNMARMELSPDFLCQLEQYSWPGNVRELINVLENAVSSAGGRRMLFPRHLPENIRIILVKQGLTKVRKAEPRFDPRPVEEMQPLKDFRKEIYLSAEREYLADLMAHAGDDLQRAIEISGLSKSRLYELIKLHNISNP